MLVHASPAWDHHSVRLLDLGRVFKINHGDHDRKADQNGLILLIDVKLEHFIVLPVVIDHWSTTLPFLLLRILPIVQGLREVFAKKKLLFLWILSK